MRKTAAYRRAIWLAGDVRSLETLVEDRLTGCPDVASTKFEYKPDIDVQVSSRSTTGDGVGCYFTLYTEGGATGTVQNGGEGTFRRPPPRGEEFLKTGIYLVIQGNNVGYVANGHTNDGQITGLLHKFITAHGGKTGDTQFGLMARADRRQIDTLLRQGVKSIDLGLSSFIQSAELANRTAVQERHSNFERGLAALRNGVADIFGQDRSAEERRAAADVEARLHLGYDGRSASELVPHLLAAIGSEIEANSDEFKIVTKRDVVITREKLAIKREVDITGDDVILDPPSAFEAIRFAMSEWQEAGLFEE